MYFALMFQFVCVALLGVTAAVAISISHHVCLICVSEAGKTASPKVVAHRSQEECARAGLRLVKELRTKTLNSILLHHHPAEQHSPTPASKHAYVRPKTRQDGSVIYTLQAQSYGTYARDPNLELHFIVLSLLAMSPSTVSPIIKSGSS